jgi:peptidyl-prolyl cis-trans isomerase C
MKRTWGIALQAATLVVCVAILGVAIRSSRAPSGVSERIDERITLASAMLNEGLPAEAVAEYQAALDLSRGDPIRKANICYLIGRTYFDSLKDYEKALGYFARAKHYNPNHPDRANMEKMSVECLERLGRSLDARNRITRATALRPNELPTSGTVVARIGDRAITINEIDATIRELPPNVQKRFAEPKEKARFLEQYVARQLLVEAAKRSGLDRDPAVLREADQARDSILAGAYLEREVGSAGNVTPEEIKLYYNEHRDEFTQPRRFDLSQIEVADEKAAKAAAKELDAGRDFAALARKLSINAETREKGGSVGTWAEGAPLPAALGDDPDLPKAIGALKPGERTPPIKMKSGKYEIIRADKVTSGTVQPLDEAQQTIAARLRQEKMIKRQEEVLARLREAEKVVIYPEAIEGKRSSK